MDQSCADILSLRAGVRFWFIVRHHFRYGGKSIHVTTHNYIRIFERIIDPREEKHKLFCVYFYTEVVNIARINFSSSSVKKLLAEGEKCLIRGAQEPTFNFIEKSIISQNCFWQTRPFFWLQEHKSSSEG
jgi:hypothetical protein